MGFASICGHTQSELHVFEKAGTFTSDHTKPEKVPGCIIFYWLIRDFVLAQFVENWEDTSKYATRVLMILNRAVDPNPAGSGREKLRVKLNADWQGFMEQKQPSSKLDKLTMNYATK